MKYGLPSEAAKTPRDWSHCPWHSNNIRHSSVHALRILDAPPVSLVGDPSWCCRHILSLILSVFITLLSKVLFLCLLPAPRGQELALFISVSQCLGQCLAYRKCSIHVQRMNEDGEKVPIEGMKILIYIYLPYTEWIFPSQESQSIYIYIYLWNLILCLRASPSINNDWPFAQNLFSQSTLQGGVGGRGTALLSCQSCGLSLHHVTGLGNWLTPSHWIPTQALGGETERNIVPHF